MSETLQLPPQETSMPVDAEREAKLHRLLGADFDFAHDNGLIDIFAYDPATGEDGLLHTLAGGEKALPQGGSVAEGFHHAPSAELITPEGEMPQTYVTGPVMANVKARRKSDFDQKPFAPYRSHVVVEGRPKVHANPNGESSLRLMNNSMYPQEYDPLAVLMTIKHAYDQRDPSQDVVTERNGQTRIISESAAPSIDGYNPDGTPKSPTQIRIVMNENQKIISAIPLDRSGALSATPEEIDHHLGL